VNSSGGSKTIGVDSRHTIDRFDTLGSDRKIQEHLRVVQETLGIQKVVEVSILHKHEILASVFGACFHNSIQGVVSGGNQNGPLAVGADFIAASQYNAFPSLSKSFTDATSSNNLGKGRFGAIAAASGRFGFDVGSKSSLFQPCLLFRPFDGTFGSLQRNRRALSCRTLAQPRIGSRNDRKCGDNQRGDLHGGNVTIAKESDKE
jgi:hypothetical protein